MKAKIALLTVALLLAFAISEAIIRMHMKIVPGVHTYSQWFNEVDTLIAYKGFYADSDGIFKTDPDVATYLHKRLSSFSPDNVPPCSLKNVCFEFYLLDKDYFEIQKPEYHSAFADYIRNLQTKDTPNLNEVEQAVLWYSKHPLNSDGFRSIEFKNYKTDRKKVLLLGDSFTWGHSAKNKTSSFADLLLAKGNVVYNAGISGSDPMQYLAIAKKYIPILKPDYVIVNFFMGNDVQYYKREVVPYKPIHFSCNASNIIACPNGIYFENQEEAYRFVKAHYHIPARTLFDKFCSLTATGTLLWKNMSEYKFYVSSIPIEYEDYWKKAEKYKSKVPVCNAELKELSDVCSNTNTKLFIIALPDYRNGLLVTPKEIPLLFDSLPYTLPAGITIDDYEASNGHYTEEGHRKHAEYIEGLVTGKSK